MPGRAEWCSVRFRFSADEVALLRGVEAVRGAALGRSAHAATLRDALTLMRAARKVASASDGGSIVLTEAETAALANAIRATLEQLERYHDYVMGWQAEQPLEREQTVLLEQVFPTAKGSAFGTSRVRRALQALLGRLEAPLRSRS